MRELPCSAQEWGASLCTPSGSSCERGPSHLEQPWQEQQQLLEVPTPVPQCRGCLAAGRAGMGAQEGTQGALRGCSTAFVALSGRGSVTRRRGGATHQVSVWFTAPSRGEAELPLSTEGPGSSPAPLSAPPSCPAAAPAACASSSSQPRPAPGAGTAPGSPRAKAHPACPGCPARRVEEFVTRLQLQSRPGPGRGCRVSLHVV